MDNNTEEKLATTKIKKSKRIFTEEELERMQYYKEKARNKCYFKNRCTCPTGFKGAGAFCSAHND